MWASCSYVILNERYRATPAPTSDPRTDATMNEQVCDALLTLGLALSPDAGTPGGWSACMATYPDAYYDT